MIVWENVMSLVDVNPVRTEHDYQTVIEVSANEIDVMCLCQH